MRVIIGSARAVPPPRITLISASVRQVEHQFPHGHHVSAHGVVLRTEPTPSNIWRMVVA